MSRVSATTMPRIHAAMIACAVLVATGGCAVQVGPAYPVDAYPGCLSDAYIATTAPVYFEGHAAYPCGPYWYYREGGRWSRYEREPPELYERRMHALPERRTYEPPVERPPTRPTPGGGHPEGPPRH